MQSLPNGLPLVAVIQRTLRIRRYHGGKDLRLQTIIKYQIGPCAATGFCKLHFPHSLGLLYSAFTEFIGFDVNGDEYKLMRRGDRLVCAETGHTFAITDNIPQLFWPHEQYGDPRDRTKSSRHSTSGRPSPTTTTRIRCGR